MGPSDGAYARASGRANIKSMLVLVDVVGLNAVAMGNIKSSSEKPERGLVTPASPKVYQKCPHLNTPIDG